jgi:hypothetical protein
MSTRSAELNHPMEQTRNSPKLGFALSLCETTIRAAHGGR